MTTSVSDTTTAEREDEMGRDKEKQVGAVAVDAATPHGSKGRRSPMSQLALPLKPWQGARYDVPYESGEVAVLPQRSTESKGSQATPDQPSAELDAPPAAPQTVAVDEVQGARFDDVTDRVLAEPEAATNTTAPAPALDQPPAAPTRARSDRLRLAALAGRPRSTGDRLRCPASLAGGAHEESSPGMDLSAAEDALTNGFAGRGTTDDVETGKQASGR